MNRHRNPPIRSALAISAALLLSLAAPAQDPNEAVKRILEKISEEMSEIDKLLLESAEAGKGAQDTEAKMKEAAEDMKKLLDASHGQSRRAEQDIADLIEQLEQMAQQGGGGGGSSSEQREQQEGQQQGRQSPRQEIDTPDLAEQRDPQQGEGQQQKQQPGQEGTKPDDGGQNPLGGTNRLDGTDRQRPTGPGQPGQGGGDWGDLPPYLHFLRTRGAPPKVPDKYRRLWEAYLKNANKNGR